MYVSNLLVNLPTLTQIRQNANKEASRIVETMMKQHQDGDSGLFLRRMNRILILASSEQENNRNQARHEMTMESLEYEDEWDLIEKCLFEFSVIQSPSSPHAYRNLAILNHYHKRDTRRAEMLYQTALLLNESQGIAEDTVTLVSFDSFRFVYRHLPWKQLVLQ